jgi:hypothetical protein
MSSPTVRFLTLNFAAKTEGETLVPNLHHRHRPEISDTLWENEKAFIRLKPTAAIRSAMLQVTIPR